MGEKILTYGRDLRIYSSIFRELNYGKPNIRIIIVSPKKYSSTGWEVVVPQEVVLTHFHTENGIQVKFLRLPRTLEPFR